MSQPLHPDPAQWPKLGDSIGPWSLEHDYNLEGSGTMFVAKRADGAFEREVLITFLRPDVTNPHVREEFEAEVALQAKLEHPGIAHFYGSDKTEGGIPYLVTEYLPGEDIENHLNRTSAPFPERIRLFCLVCEAVQYAHSHDIAGLHLQAENIHLMPDDTVRLVVYGLARSNQKVQATRHSSWPEYAIDYASPEEWAGSMATTHSDGYSLGVLLHVLLTGVLPFDHTGLTPAESAAAIHQPWLKRASETVKSKADKQLADERGCTVKQLVQSLTGDLDRILEKSLALEPKHRYETPAALADDLQRYLAGQPIRARGPAPFYIMRRAFVRHRVAIAASTVVLGSSFWALQASIRSAHRAETALQDSEIALGASEEVSARLRDLCIRYLVELGPTMQGRPGLEDTRRYLLNAGVPLLDHLRKTGHVDRKLESHLANSYTFLAEADWIARDQKKGGPIPESVPRARDLTFKFLKGAMDAGDLKGAGAWVRSIRAAVWFHALALDAEAGEQELTQTQAELATLGITPSYLPAVSRFHLMEAEFHHHAHLLQFDKAIEMLDLTEIQGLIAEDSAMQIYFEGDLPRIQGERAAMLVRAGRERDALFELPTIVHQLEEDSNSHFFPMANLHVFSTQAWTFLALARARVGLPPGKSISAAREAIAFSLKHHMQEPGMLEDVARFQLNLGECLYLMGAEHWPEAMEHFDAATANLEKALQNGALWPYYRVLLAEIHWWRAQVRDSDGRQEEATQAILKAQGCLENLAAPATGHPAARLAKLRVEMMQAQLSTPPNKWQRQLWQELVEELKQSQVNKNLLAPLRAQLRVWEEAE